jgi:hypothetical protein
MPCLNLAGINDIQRHRGTCFFDLVSVFILIPIILAKDLNTLVCVI